MTYSDRACFAPCDPGMEIGGGLIEIPAKKLVVNCSHFL